MSRIGRKLITVPAGVDVTIGENNLVTVKGPKGTLCQKVSPKMTIKHEGATIQVSRPDDENESRALHGLTRTLIANMVEGVTNGYSKTLEIIGVGYKAQKNGKTLVLSLGHSHTIEFVDNDQVTFDVVVDKTTKVIVKGIDKQVVGQVAAQIREKRPPEPYKGKGVRYDGEFVRRKAGKTGK